MKQYSVTLNGATLPLQFDYDSRESVEELFKRPDGTPGSLWELVIGHLERLGSVKVQTALLWGALQHNGPEWTLQKVTKEVRSYLEAGGDMADLNRAVYRSILANGAMGKTFDVDEGKDQSPAA